MLGGMLFTLRLLRRTSGLWIYVVITVLLLCELSVEQIGKPCKYFHFKGSRRADCQNRSLTSLPQDMHENTQILNFGSNKLSVLGPDFFIKLRGLQELSLVNNNIKLIDKHAFRGLSNLRELDLSNNTLDVMPSESFQYIPRLTKLHVSFNQIRNISENAFHYLKDLVEIKLEGNWIEKVHPKAFKELKQLKKLNLVYNVLKGLDPAMEENIPPSLDILRVYNNPWNCDCKIRWLRHWLENQKINWKFQNTPPTCAGPQIINNVRWDMLTPSQFACASQILSNSSFITVIKLEETHNVTLTCHVYGDPDPSVTWEKGGREIHDSGSHGKYKITSRGSIYIHNMLTINKIKESDAGNYKCEARNNAGRAEVTYTVTIKTNGVGGGKGTNGNGNLTRNLLIAVGVAGAGLVLVLIIVIACVIHYRDRRRHAYRVRDYKKEQKRKRKENEATPQAEILNDKKEEKRELLPNDVKSPPLVIEGRERRDNSSSDEYQFRMKIFLNGEKEESSQMDSDKEESTFDTDKEPTKTEMLRQNHMTREVTPDLIRNGSHESSIAESQRDDTPDSNIPQRPKSALVNKNYSSGSDRSTPDKIAEGVAKKLSQPHPVRFALESEDSGSSDSDRLIKERARKPSPHKQRSQVSKAGSQGSRSSRSETESPSSELSAESVIHVDLSGRRVMSPKTVDTQKKVPSRPGSAHLFDSNKSSPQQSRPTSPAVINDHTKQRDSHRDSPIDHSKHRDSPTDHCKHRDSPIDHCKHRDAPIDHCKHRDSPIDHSKHRDSPIDHSKHRDSPTDHKVHHRDSPVNHKGVPRAKHVESPVSLNGSPQHPNLPGGKQKNTSRPTSPASTATSPSPKHIPNATSTLPRSTSPRPTSKQHRSGMKSPVSPDKDDLRKPGAWHGCSPATATQPVHSRASNHVHNVPPPPRVTIQPPSATVAQPVIHGARPDTAVSPTAAKPIIKRTRFETNPPTRRSVQGKRGSRKEGEQYPGVGKKDEYGTAV